MCASRVERRPRDWRWGCSRCLVEDSARLVLAERSLRFAVELELVGEESLLLVQEMDEISPEIGKTPSHACDELKKALEDVRVLLFPKFDSICVY